MLSDCLSFIIPMKHRRHDTQHNGTWHNDTQHNVFSFDTKLNDTVYCQAECHIFIVMLSGAFCIVMLGGILLSDVVRVVAPKYVATTGVHFLLNFECQGPVL